MGHQQTVQQIPPARSLHLLALKPGSLNLPLWHRASRLSAPAGAALACGTLRRAYASERADSGSPSQRLLPPAPPAALGAWAGSSLLRGTTWELDPATPRTNKATTSLSREGASNICGALAGPWMKRATRRVKSFLSKPSVFPIDATLKHEQLVCLLQTNMPNNEMQRDH